MSDQAELVLSPNMDLMAAGALREDLIARRGSPLAINAGGVQRFGGLCLQVLISAKREWDAASVPFSFTERSRDFDESVRLMGAMKSLGLAPQDGNAPEANGARM